MDKAQLKQRICAQLEADLALLIASAEQARQAATHEESKAENKYDTRGLEASYLAAGQSRRVEQIRQTLKTWQDFNLPPYDDAVGIQLGALITLRDALGKHQRVVLSPDGAGLKLADSQGEILLISSQAPLGKALLGLGPDDVVNIAASRWQVLEVD